MATTKSVSVSKLVSAADATKLGKLGVHTSAELMKAAPSASKERSLAQKSGVSASVVREAVNRADLMQVKGIGVKMADKFENAGVNSARELAHRNPAALARELDANPKTMAALVSRAQALFGSTGVSTLDEAKDKAGAALATYVNEALFSDDPRGASFRSEVSGADDKANWPAMKQGLLDEIPAWLGRGPSKMGNSSLEETSEDKTGFWIVGRFDGLHTEVHINKDTGAAENLLVEID